MARRGLGQDIDRRGGSSIGVRKIVNQSRKFSLRYSKIPNECEVQKKNTKLLFTRKYLSSRVPPSCGRRLRDETQRRGMLDFRRSLESGPRW